MDKTIDFKLYDNSGNYGSVEGTVTVSSNWVDIGIKGFSSAGGNDLIGLEMYKGRLMLRIWSDSQGEDATHVIDLTTAIEQAKQSEQ